jgi:hypothetical protein
MSQPTRSEVSVLLKKAQDHRRRIQELQSDLTSLMQRIAALEAKRSGRTLERRRTARKK